MKKRLLALLLTAIMVLSLVPMTVLAAYTNTYSYKCGPTEVVVTDLSTQSDNKFKLVITQKGKNTDEYNKQTLYDNTVELILNPEEHSIVGTFTTDDYSMDVNTYLKSGSNMRYVSGSESSTITIVSKGGNKYAITDGLLQVENSSRTYLYKYDYCYDVDDLNDKSAEKTPFEFTFGEAPAHTHGTGTEAVTFEKAIKTRDELNQLFKAGGSGYLANDIECPRGLVVDRNVKLCLNDKVLNLAGEGNITVNNTSFTLYDCGTTVRYYDKDTTTGLWTLNTAKTSGDYSTTGGVITGGKVQYSYGGGVCVNSGTFTMNGGNISGNSTGASGGGVYANGGTINLNGGTICGNTAAGGGGGVYFNKCSFYMNNGSITDNYVKKGAGGGVYAGTDSTLTMVGGSITGNKAVPNGNTRGGVYFSNTSTVTLGGTAKITDNKVVENSAEIINNVMVKDNCAFNIGTKTGSDNGNGVAAPSTEFNVGVTTKTAPTATAPVKITSNGTADDVKCFTSDNADYAVQYNTNGYLELAPAHTHTPVLVNGQAATETAAGWKDYYQCECGDRFEDAAGLVPIKYFNEWKSEGGNGYIPSGNEIKAAKEEAKEWFANPLNSLFLGYYSPELAENAIPGVDELTSLEEIEQYKADYIADLLEAREAAFKANSYLAMKNEVKALCENLGFDEERTDEILSDFAEFINGDYNDETTEAVLGKFIEDYYKAEGNAEKAGVVENLCFSMVMLFNSNWVNELTAETDDIYKALVDAEIVFYDNTKLPEILESNDHERIFNAVLECYGDIIVAFFNCTEVEEELLPALDTTYAARRNNVKADKPAGELIEAKEEAIKSVTDVLPEYATEEAKAIAEQAVTDIDAAETVTKVEEIKTNAIDEIKRVMADVCPHCGKVHKNIFYDIYCYVLRCIRWFVTDVRYFVLCVKEKLGIA